MRKKNYRLINEEILIEHVIDDFESDNGETIDDLIYKLKKTVINFLKKEGVIENYSDIIKLGLD
jgi:hypothetical protein